MRKYSLIASAVAVALGSGHAFAVNAPPTLAQAAAAQVKFYIAGSSAAQSAFGVAVATDLCGGTGALLTIKSVNPTGLTTGNFRAFSCLAPVNAAVPGNLANGTNIFTFYYRAEGGSVTGALPIVHNTAVKTLNLSDTTNCTASGNSGSCTVLGTPAANGPNDSWTGGVTTHTVELGIADVEPAALTGDNFPSLYTAAAFGSATPTDLANLTTHAAFGQVFGIFVNTHGTGLGNVTALNLTKETIANILVGNYTDWHKVPDASGNPVATATSPITLLNREAGSGTRTSASIYFLNDNCAATGSAVSDPSNGTADYYSTGDILTAANGTGGAFTYASIDNAGSKANLVMVSIDGVTPSQLAAVAGTYDYWVEAALQPNPAAYDTNGANVDAWLEPELQNVATAPPSAQVFAIPNVGTNPAGAVPLTFSAHGGQTIYLNPYTRAGNSCNFPSETN